MDQVFLILDREKTEIVWNGSWFDKMTFSDVIKLSSQYTVARMLERDDFSKRYAEGRAIHIHEFLYPLVQGHDSIEVQADIELGGTDQKFNLLVGRELMREAGMTPQCIMTMPLLVGLDGEKKMSKSLNNYIGLTEAPEEIYGKAMSVPDTMMRDYMVLVLGWRPEAAEGKLAEVAGGRRHPRDLKSEIAEAVTARFHGEAGGVAGREHFDRVIRQKEVPDEVETVELQAEDRGLLLAKAVVGAELAKSTSEARRLIEGGGVSLDGVKISDVNYVLDTGEYLLKVGKRHFRRIRLT
jgi:tyrosyl-tRNA synthetase